jgi:hypothetical protein
MSVATLDSIFLTNSITLKIYSKVHSLANIQGQKKLASQSSERIQCACLGFSGCKHHLLANDVATTAKSAIGDVRFSEQRIPYQLLWLWYRYRSQQVDEFSEGVTCQLIRPKLDLITLIIDDPFCLLVGNSEDTGGQKCFN